MVHSGSRPRRPPKPPVSVLRHPNFDHPGPKRCRPPLKSFVIPCLIVLSPFLQLSALYIALIGCFGASDLRGVGPQRPLRGVAPGHRTGATQPLARRQYFRKCCGGPPRPCRRLPLSQPFVTDIDGVWFVVVGYIHVFPHSKMPLQFRM